jgi:hypothetical protein
LTGSVKVDEKADWKTYHTHQVLDSGQYHSQGFAAIKVRRRGFFQIAAFALSLRTTGISPTLCRDPSRERPSCLYEPSDYHRPPSAAEA